MIKNLKELLRKSWKSQREVKSNLRKRLRPMKTRRNKKGLKKLIGREWKGFNNKSKASRKRRKNLRNLLKRKKKKMLSWI